MSLAIFFNLTCSDRITHVVASTSCAIPTLVEMWTTEAKESRTTADTVETNSACTLYKYICNIPSSMIHDKIVIPHGGGESSVARTALDHLRHELSRSSHNSSYLTADMNMLDLLSSYTPLRNAILHEGSLVYVCELFRKASSMDDSFCDCDGQTLSFSCCSYLSKYLDSNDGVSNILEALKGGFLVSLLRSRCLLACLVDEDIETCVSLISLILPKYLLHRNVLVLVKRSIRIVDADTGSHATHHCVGPIWDAWSALKELARSRQKQLHFHRELAGYVCGSTDVGSSIQFDALISHIFL